MFERLTDAFQGLYRKLSGQAAISEKNIADAMTDVRTALLEADAHLDAVDAFIDSVMKDAIGTQVTQSLTPAQEIVGIVHKRLVEFLGGDTTKTATIHEGPIPGLPIAATPEPPAPDAAIMRVSPPPTIVMMCGLQGSGKTTTCGKLAAYLKKRGRSVMVAAADLQRPAAVEQLQTVAAQVESEMPGGAKVLAYAEPDKVAAYGKAVGVAVDVSRRALDAARKAGVDVLILDTAGRLHVNDALMGELQQINRALSPHHIFLVVDAMTGHDAVNSARAFHEKLEVDAIILTKFDSDTRGGAALSVKHVTGAPIKFVGVGEKLDALEEFHATRMAGRILGMGDVVSLVEKAQESVSQEEAEQLSAKMARGEISMDDFLKQLRTLRRMGPLKHLLALLPGVGPMLKDVQIDDNELDKVEAVINSMNKKERAKPAIVDSNRRRRIARGAGVTTDAVARLLKQFDMMGKMTKAMADMGGTDKAKAVKERMAAGMGMPGLARGSSFTPSLKSKFKKRK